MQIDLAALKPGQIALLGAAGTIAAAFVAGIAALSVALVNFYAAKHLARYNAQLKYRQNLLKPLIDRLDQDIEFYNSLIERFISVQAEGLENMELLADLQKRILKGLPGALARVTPLQFRYLVEHYRLLGLRERKLSSRFQKLEDSRLRFLNRAQAITSDRRSNEWHLEIGRLFGEARELIGETISVRIALDRYTVN